MHIPDGYLSPATAGTLYAAAAPFWFVGVRKLRRFLSARTIPMMALLSAFCFVIQMINVPLPGGTTGHAVGAALAAIVLGPWPAVIAVSVVLVIQALFFGDGGLTTLGANCFNMAIVQVFAGYFFFRLLAVRTQSPKGYGLAAAIAGYISLNFAALLAGVELGIQPLIAKAADGTPLYAPYALSVSVPAMVFSHLIAGFAEAVVAGAAVAYLVRSEILQLPVGSALAFSESQSSVRRLWLVLAILVVVTPLGLLAPGTAWGEWSAEQLRKMGLGFVPTGVQHWEGWWRGLLADYSVPGFGQKTGYIFSAVIGVLFILLVFAVIALISRKALRNKNA